MCVCLSADGKHTCLFLVLKCQFSSPRPRFFTQGTHQEVCKGAPLLHCRPVIHGVCNDHRLALSKNAIKGRQRWQRDTRHLVEWICHLCIIGMHTAHSCHSKYNASQQQQQQQQRVSSPSPPPPKKTYPNTQQRVHAQKHAQNGGMKRYGAAGVAWRFSPGATEGSNAAWREVANA